MTIFDASRQEVRIGALNGQYVTCVEWSVSLDYIYKLGSDEKIKVVAIGFPFICSSLHTQIDLSHYSYLEGQTTKGRNRCPNWIRFLLEYCDGRVKVQ